MLNNKTQYYCLLFISALLLLKNITQIKQRNKLNVSYLTAIIFIIKLFPSHLIALILLDKKLISMKYKPNENNNYCNRVRIEINLARTMSVHVYFLTYSVTERIKAKDLESYHVLLLL